MSKQLMTVREVASLINVAEKTIYGWVEKGKIPAFKIGGALRFDPLDIDELIRASRVSPVSPKKMAKSILGKDFMMSYNKGNNGTKSASHRKEKNYV